MFYARPVCGTFSKINLGENSLSIMLSDSVAEKAAERMMMRLSLWTFLKWNRQPASARVARAAARAAARSRACRRECLNQREQNLGTGNKIWPRMSQAEGTKLAEKIAIIAIKKSLQWDQTLIEKVAISGIKN